MEYIEFFKDWEKNRKKWWALHAQIQKFKDKDKNIKELQLPDNCKKPK